MTITIHLLPHGDLVRVGFLFGGKKDGRRVGNLLLSPDEWRVFKVFLLEGAKAIPGRTHEVMIITHLPEKERVH